MFLKQVLFVGSQMCQVLVFRIHPQFILPGGLWKLVYQPDPADIRLLLKPGNLREGAKRMRYGTFVRSVSFASAMACLFVVTVMVLSGTSASASSSPMALKVGGGSGWLDDSWEDDNVALRFSIVGSSVYMKLTNKTQYVIRLQWPEASLRLADGTLRTTSFVFEYEVIQQPLPMNLKDAKWELRKGASNEDLFFNAGRTGFLELGVRVDDSSIPLKGDVINYSAFREKSTAKADSLIPLLAMLPEGSFITWILYYDFAGKDFIKEVHLKLAN